MIVSCHRRASAAEALAEALGRPVGDQEALTGHTVVAHGPRLDHHTPGQKHHLLTAVKWARILDDPTTGRLHDHGGQPERLPVLQHRVRSHPADRTLTPAEWQEIAYRLTRAAGIAPSGQEHTCRWITVQAQPQRLDIIASLIRDDGTRAPVGHQLPRHLYQETRRLAADLCLTPSNPGNTAPPALAGSARVPPVPAGGAGGSGSRRIPLEYRHRHGRSAAAGSAAAPGRRGRPGR